jgi:hypothetical protein
MAYISDQVRKGASWKPSRFRQVTPAKARGGAGSSGFIADLTKAIETDIVPRLVMAHRQTAAVTPAQPDRGGSKEVGQFAQVILRQDTVAACAHVQALREQGQALQAIYLDLLAPTAARLRNLWSADLCDFADVTLGLWRLQQVVREFSTEFRHESEHVETGLGALLVPAPGEKKELGYMMFGLVMMAEFLRRDGIDAWIEPDSSSSEFGSIVRSQWFDVVELLVSGDKKMDALAERIRMIRRESPNRGVGVMVCGPAFVEHPELVLLVGADVMANDPRQGAVQAKKAVGLLANR